MKNKTITVHKVNVPLLRRQKQALFEIVFNARVHHITDNHYDLLHGLVHFLDACTDAAEDRAKQKYLPDCECDNTHENNKTVCRACYDAGYRYETAWWRQEP